MGGIDNGNTSPGMRPLGLSEEEKQYLVAFMTALSSPGVPQALPRLPQ